MDRVTAKQQESSGLIIVDVHSEPEEARSSLGQASVQEDRAEFPIHLLSL